ncbi:MAG: aminotransferase, partial [Pseudobutyrivibrio sp.]|nr:aminotransferase [Pseudobutyrivibrio sp.]
MKKYSEMSPEELAAEKELLRKEYVAWQAKGLKLDMSRGKPSIEQLNLSMPLFDILDGKSLMKCMNGVETRNYGQLEGIVEAQHLMAEIMDCQPEQVIVCGNSSLNIMFDTVARGYMFGFDGCTPWCKLDRVRWLCPVPGYDRHFAITQHFGFDMINVPMNEDGPDMDVIEGLVAADDSIKGIWCVPKYSNPQGIVYSDEVVRRMANLKPAAKDFRVFWDNAYAVHHLYKEKSKILNILHECEEADNPNLVFEFASTSKITFAGGGIAAIACNHNNREELKKTLTVQTIGFDKINMLRHARYFQDVESVSKHMEKHAKILR